MKFSVFHNSGRENIDYTEGERNMKDTLQNMGQRKIFKSFAF